MRLYKWKSSNSSAAAFLLLLIDPKYDAFSLDLAYASDGVWIPGAGMASRPGETLRNGRLTVSLNRIVAPERKAVVQWWLEPSPQETSSLISPPVEQSALRVNECVRDAVAKLTEYGIPELRRLAQSIDDQLVG